MEALGDVIGASFFAALIEDSVKVLKTKTTIAHRDALRESHHYRQRVLKTPRGRQNSNAGAISRGGAPTPRRPSLV